MTPTVDQEAVECPRHHIDGDMLLAYAAGSLGEGASLVVATHLTFCPSCRSAVLAAESVGGTLLEEIEPEAISATGVSKALALLDAESPKVAEPKYGADTLFDTLFDTIMPRPIAAYLPRGALRWRWVSPGVKFAELLIDDGGARIGLMRAMPDASITPHGHSGDELTMVLSGGYRDGAARFQRGDVQAVDDTVIHEPVTDSDGTCLSLVMIQGPVKPTRWIARIFRHFTAF